MINFGESYGQMNRRRCISYERKEFERRLDKKIQDHAKIMSDEKRKKIHTDYAKNHSQNELFAVCIEEMSELTKHLTKIMRGKESMRNNAGCIEEMADVQICLNTLQLYLDLSESDFNYAIDVKLERYNSRK